MGTFLSRYNIIKVYTEEYCRSKNRFPEVLCVFQIPPEQTPDSLLSGKFLSLRKSEYRRSNSLQKILLQRAVELRRRSLILLRCPPAVTYHHAGENCSAGNPPPRENPRLKCTCTEAISKKFN
jgi:hypothetical protein